MQEMNPRERLQDTVEKLSALQPGNAALQALKEALPDLSAAKAEAILNILSARIGESAVEPSAAATVTASAPGADRSTVMRELGSNFLGAEAWAKLGLDVGPVPPIPSTITRELLNSPCPLHPGSTIKDTHLLVLVPKTVNGESYSGLKLDELCKSRKGTGDMLIDGGWNEWKSEEWAKEPQGASEWVLIPKSEPHPENVPVDKHFRYKYIPQQQAVHDAHYKEYREVKAVELMTATLLSDLVNGGSRMLKDCMLRCKEAGPAGGRVVVGFFFAHGLKVVADCGVYDDLYVGRALARKI